MNLKNIDVIRATKILEDEIVDELSFLANRIIMKNEKNVQELLITEVEREHIETIKENDILLELLNKYKGKITK